MLEERFGALRIELRRRLVEQQELRLERERGGEADALELAAGKLGDAPAGEVRRGRQLRVRAPTRDAILRGGVPTFSSPNATSAATRVSTTWSSGSWNTVATMPASSADRVRR